LELLRGELSSCRPRLLTCHHPATLAEILCDFVKPRKLGWCSAPKAVSISGMIPIRCERRTWHLSGRTMPDPVPRASSPGLLICRRGALAQRSCLRDARQSVRLDRGRLPYGLGVDPETRSIAVYASKAKMRVLHVADTLTDRKYCPIQVEIRKYFHKLDRTADSHLYDAGLDQCRPFLAPDAAEMNIQTDV